MMNLLVFYLIFTSLFLAQVCSPSPVVNQPQKKQVEDVIEKEGHEVIVVVARVRCRGESSTLR